MEMGKEKRKYIFMPQCMGTASFQDFLVSPSVSMMELNVLEDFVSLTFETFFLSFLPLTIILPG